MNILIQQLISNFHPDFGNQDHIDIKHAITEYKRLLNLKQTKETKDLIKKSEVSIINKFKKLHK